MIHVFPLWLFWKKTWLLQFSCPSQRALVFLFLFFFQILIHYIYTLSYYYLILKIVVNEWIRCKLVQWFSITNSCVIRSILAWFRTLTSGVIFSTVRSVGRIKVYSPAGKTFFLGLWFIIILMALARVRTPEAGSPKEKKKSSNNLIKWGIYIESVWQDFKVPSSLGRGKRHCR